MPEALEKWPVSLFERLLPRHLEIIYEINARFLNEVARHYPGDEERLRRMSIIEEWPERSIRMAYLATIAAFSVNGVASLHTDLLKNEVLVDFHALWPHKFNNKTNGVSPRRFIRQANPRLSKVITDTVGEGWLNNLDMLQKLEPCADDVDFRAQWREIKHQNKLALTEEILRTTGIQVNPDAMFDVMVKRLHEYKRQLLKVLHIITLYNRIKDNPQMEMVPRTFIFGAKAAPGYRMAKLIIKMINAVGDVVNNDPVIGDRLKMAFLPNFNVTLGEKIYPAADLSEQISMAGKEASGTGNMKFALNGAVTIGTLDGANIEIRERVGPDNFYLFGLTTPQVLNLKASGTYRPLDLYYKYPELKQAIDMINRGVFSEGIPELFRPITDALLYSDDYLLLADYPSFIATQDMVSQDYQDVERWTRMSILNTARCGYFSSDRAVRQYCEDIWGVKPVSVP